MSKAELMHKIRSLSFAKCESELFLDTHPGCKEALDYYHSVVNSLNQLTKEYETSFGPITSSGVSMEKWNWVDAPWPWFVEDNEDAEIIKGGRKK